MRTEVGRQKTDKIDSYFVPCTSYFVLKADILVEGGLYVVY